jgi:hypothetical protein
MDVKIFNKKLIAALVAAGFGFASVQAHADLEFRVPLKGLKPVLALGVNPTHLDFGNVALGQSGSASVTVSNAGGTTAQAMQYQVTPANMPYTVSGCGTELAAGGQCVETIRFTPTAGQPFPATFTAFNDQQSVATSLQGTGLQTSDRVSVGTLAFGNQKVGTTATAQSVQLTNTGNTAVSITSIPQPTGPYAATQNCGSSLAIGATCSVNVTFSPTAQGSQPGTLTINTAAGTQTVSLTGTGTGATLTASPTSLAWGNVALNTTTSKTFTVTNMGNAAAPVTLGALPGGFASSNNCGASLAVNGSCTVTVSFDPTAAGSYGGTFSVLGGTNASSVSVSGTNLCFSPGAQAFTGNGTFTPTVGCNTYLVLAVGGGGGGGCGYGGGGGSGHVAVSYANGLTSPIAVTMGYAGGVNTQWGQSYTGGTSCFGGICAAGGSPGQGGYAGGGAGGSGGGGGNLPGYAYGNGGSWGNSGTDGTGAGQGNYASAVALFHYHSITGGAGGTAFVQSAYKAGEEGGGGGGILFDGSGPAGGGDAGGVGNAGGIGWGAGGGGGYDTGARGPVNWCIAGGPGAQGLVYVEWSQ